MLKFLKDLKTNGCLAFYDTYIIKRRDEGHAIFLSIGFCSNGTFIIVVSRQTDLDGIFTKHPCLVYLLLGCDDGHEYDPFNAQFFAAVCKALCMIARTCANHPFGKFVMRKAAHHIVCTTQLVRPYYLKVLSFQVYVTVVLPGEVEVKRKRRFISYLFNGIKRSVKVKAQFHSQLRGVVYHYAFAFSAPGTLIPDADAWFSGLRLRTVLPACHSSLSLSSASSFSSPSR